MKRIAIFAHYDKHSIIDNYVIFYLESLKKSVDKIIFVSDCILSADELKKIDHVVFKTICEEHGEYDFGSYKRGFFFLKENYLKELNELDELVFANDSCYSIGNFEEVFKKMSTKECDFWGMTQNTEQFQPHIQSYFVSFRSRIVKSECFSLFLKKIQKEPNKHDIIKNYEVGLTKILCENGFKKESFIDKIFEINPTLCANTFIEIMTKRMPLIKVELAIKNPSNINSLDKTILGFAGGKNFDLIKSHRNRMRKNNKIMKLIKVFFK
jgi:O-antigen biosynthesis protein